MPSQSIDKARIRRRLLRWYDRHRRDLPWRRNPQNAYYQMVAEIMLQQTQVGTVIPYYQRFIRRFPDVRTLAESSLDDVLQHWAGLGYYARARHLHRTAAMLVANHGGNVPGSVASLQALPGIGRSTAGAIASISFNCRAAVLDGNVRRVLARLHCVRTDLSRPKAREMLWRQAEALLPARRYGDFNQALMELGATRCAARKPQCPDCPLMSDCAAYAAGEVTRIPVRAAARTPRSVEMVVAAIRHKRKFLLQKRDPAGLWGGLWQMPTLERHTGSSPLRQVQKLLRECLPTPSPGFRVSAEPFGIRHQLTHRTLKLNVYECISRFGRQPRPRSGNLKWVDEDQVAQYALAKAQHKIFRVLAERG